MKFKIISNTLIKNKAYMEGEVIELNENDQGDLETMGLLYAAARIREIPPGEKTPKK